MTSNFLSDYASRIDELRSSTETESDFSHITNQIYLDHAANAIYMARLNLFFLIRNQHSSIL